MPYYSFIGIIICAIGRIFLLLKLYNNNFPIYCSQRRVPLSRKFIARSAQINNIISRQSAMRNTHFSLSSRYRGSCKKQTAGAESEQQQHTHSRAPDWTRGHKKRKAPTSAVCHQFRSIYFACGPLDWVLGPGINMESSEWILRVFGSRCNIRAHG